MQISRRDALATGAAAAVTGLTAAPLAIKTAGVKAALAGDPILPLYAQWRAAETQLADMEATDAEIDRVIDLQVRIIHTPAATLYGLLSKARLAWYITAQDWGNWDIEEAGPDLDAEKGKLDDYRMIWSILQDVERLAGEARS